MSADLTIIVKEYYSGIDILKGILIIIVIIGHVLTGSLNNNIVRYVIYGFHMPLFLAVSGFLIREEWLKKVSIKELYKKYQYRMLTPWLLASVAYLVVTESILPSIPIDIFFRPYFHLWYILSLFIMITILWMVYKLHVPIWFILLGSFLISLWWLNLFFGGKYPISGPSQPNPLYYLGDMRTYVYFLFFYLGYIIRNVKYQNKKHKVCTLLVTTFMGCIYILNFYHHLPSIVVAGAFIILNVLLAQYLLNYVAKREIKKYKWLKSIGMHSLPIYLWHVIIILVTEHFISKHADKLIYYTVTFLSVGLFIYLIILLTPKLVTLSKYLFGNNENLPFNQKSNWIRFWIDITKLETEGKLEDCLKNDCCFE